MKIALYDDHPIILNGLKSFFETKEDVEVIATMTLRNEVIDLLKNQDVDVLVSDVITDEEIGLELFEEIQKMNLPATKVVVYSSLKGDFVHDFLYSYGVVAIVNKNRGLDDLWQVVELAYLNSWYKKKRQQHDPQPMLTTKEKEIIKYLSRGLAAKEIAVLTDTAFNTINNQKKHLLAKFDCMNTTELIAKMTQMGYLKV